MGDEKVKIINCSFNGNIKNESTYSATGGILGVGYSSDCEIENCKVSGKIESKSSYAGVSGTGGIIGEGRGTVNVKKSYNKAEIEGTKNVGGIGNNVNYIDECYNEGKVTGEVSVGGIVGRSAKMITNSYNKGNINGKTNIGGISGDQYNGGQNELIFGCYNLGDIIGLENCVGGIVGAIASTAVKNLTIEACYNSGRIEGKAFIAGIIGNISADYFKAVNCFNTGNITSTTNSNVAGISLGTGYISSALIISCYNTGNLQSNGIKYGISCMRSDKNPIRNSYCLSTCGAKDTLAEKKTSEELKKLVSVLDRKIKYVKDEENNDIDVELSEMMKDKMYGK